MSTDLRTATDLVADLAAGRRSAVERELERASVADVDRLLDELGSWWSSVVPPADDTHRDDAAPEWELLWRCLVTRAGHDSDLVPLAAVVDRCADRLTSWQLHKLANRVAWSTRGAETALPGEVDGPGTLFVLYVALERKRFHFDRDAVRAIRTRVRVPATFDNAVLRSYDAFVVIRVATDTQAALVQVDRVLSRPDVALFYEVCFDIVAQATWLNVTMKPPGVLLADICERWVTAMPDPGPVADFRFAAALRLQGRYAEAIVRVEKALGAVSGGSEFARTFSEQCIRERELSIAGLSVRETELRLAAEVERLEDAVREVERKSITRVIEVVTLFTAAAAFALGGVSTVANAQLSAPELLVVITGLACGLLLFSVASLVTIEVTAHREDPVPTRRLLAIAAVVGLVCVLFLGASVGVALLGDAWSG